MSRQTKEARKAYEVANADQIRAQRSAWRAANRERESARTAAWRAEHRPGERAKKSRRRALKRGAVVSDFTDADWRDLCSTWSRCAYCWRQDVKLTRDHAVPLSRGGDHTKSNIVPACGRCNDSKGSRTAFEFAGWV